MTPKEQNLVRNLLKRKGLFTDELSTMSLEDLHQHLDDLVHDAKSSEAESLNSQGPEGQLDYLLGK